MGRWMWHMGTKDETDDFDCWWSIPCPNDFNIKKLDERLTSFYLIQCGKMLTLMSVGLWMEKNTVE